jgi:hypothetical protein
MKEHFTVTIPRVDSFLPFNLFKYLISFVISIAIIYPVLGLTSTESIISIILLFLIIYIIINSMTTENLSNELPSTIYPYPPNLGLDGISMNAYVAGLSTNPYIV